MKSLSCAFSYPVKLVADRESGGFVVTFPDVPEAITQGEDLDDALAQAEDCLDEAVANRIAMNLELPVPSVPGARQRVVCLRAGTALKAAFYATIRELKVSKVELAARLGVDEREVRRLLDPHHPSKLNRIDELLQRLGRRVVIGLQPAPSARR